MPDSTSSAQSPASSQMAPPAPTQHSQMRNAQAQGSDLALRQQALLHQIASLIDQTGNLALIAPFVQDEVMMMMSLFQSIQAKILTTVGADIEASQGTMAAGTPGGANQSSAPPATSQALPPMPA